MSQKCDANTRSFNAIEAIPLHALVSMSSTGVQVCAINEEPIGVATREAFAAGNEIAVKLFTGAGTHKMIASAALAKGASCFTAADGEIGASASTAYRIGIVLEAAGADQDIVEVLVISPGVAVS